MTTGGMRRVLRWWRYSLALGLAGFVFFPSLVEAWVPLRVIAIGLGTVALLTELLARAPHRRRRLLWGLLLPATVAVSVASIEWVAHVTGDRMLAVNAEHLLVLAPLFAWFGALTIQSRSARTYGIGYLLVAAIASVLAIVESAFGFSTLGRDVQFLTSQREGITRALVGAEHVLVLGALIAVAVALAPIIAKRWLRVILSVLLIVGCVATGSRAAAAAAVIVAVMQAAPPIVRALQRWWWLPGVLVTSAFIALGLLAQFAWTTHIPGATGTAFSANYRFASYAMIADVLEARPFGYLLQSPPLNTWMMSSDLRGAVDLVHSADSELVFAIFTAGWIGAVTYLAAFWIGFRALRDHPILAMAASTMTGLGLIMSLHGWDAASTLWYALLGACIGASFNRRHAAQVADERRTPSSAPAPSPNSKENTP